MLLVFVVIISLIALVVLISTIISSKLPICQVLNMPVLGLLFVIIDNQSLEKTSSKVVLGVNNKNFSLELRDMPSK